MGGDQTLNIIIKARDEATATLNKFRGTMDDMKPAFQKMAAVGTAAFVAIGAVAKSSIDTFIADQKDMTVATQALTNALSGMNTDAVAKLQTTLPGTGTALSKLKTVMEDTGKAALKMGFDDEAAAQGFAKLFQVSGDVTQAQKDLALAMDLADFSGKSLEESISAVTKVHAGGTRILKDFGIEVADGTTATDALAIAQQKVAGTTQAMVDAGLKGSEILKNSMDNLKSAIGEALAPAMNKALQAVIPLIEKFTAWAEQNPELLSKIILIGGAVAALVAGLGTLGLILGPVAAGFALLMSPITLLIGVIVFAAITIVKNWRGAMEQLQVIWGNIKNAFAGVVNFLVGLAEGFANTWVKAVNFVIAALNKIKFSIPSWVPGIGGKSFGINIEMMKEVTLPRFEQGGIVPGARGTATPIMAHGGEQIIPARNVRGTDGMTIAITLNYPSFKNQEDTEVVKKQIENAMRDVVRLYKLQPL